MHSISGSRSTRATDLPGRPDASRAFTVCALLALGVLWVNGSLRAQTTAGELRGSVSDSTGAVVAGAAVTVQNGATSDTRKANSDSDGGYLFPQLPVGRYILTVEMPGFQKFTLRDVVIQVDSRRREDVALKVGDVSQEVTVAATAQAVNSTNATLGEVIDQRPIVNLPLNGRNFLQLAQLTPGAVPPVLQNGEDTTSSANGRRTNLSVSVSGTRHVSSAYLFDGVLGREEYYGAVAIQPVIEGIAEFKIMRGYFGPEFAAPAIVSVVSKSGSNEVHGGAWEFLRNDAMDSRNRFDFSAKKPPLRQNQFGASLGGPVKKDRLFFMANFELIKLRQAFPANLMVPTQGMLSGNFSGFNPIYDPATADAQRIKQPFANNQVPSSRINAFAQKYNDFILTSPLSPVDPAARAQGFNLFGRQRVVQDTYKWDTRWDYGLSSNDRLFGRINWDQTDQTDVNPQRGNGRLFPLYGRNAVLSWSRIASASFVNDLRAGFNRTILRAGGPVQGENADWPAFFGIRNLSTTPGCAGVPIVGLTDFGSWGFSSGSCLIPNSQIFSVFDNASWVKGKHRISFGGQLERMNLRHEVAFNPQGNFSFSGQFTEAFNGTNRVAGTGNPAADYLLGWPSNATGQARVTPTYRRGWWWAMYINDDVQVSKQLTINLGLRYQVQQPLIEKYDNIAEFDFATGVQRFAGKNGVRRGLYPTDYNDFGPRIGLAWRPSDSDDMAVRASYGVFYDRLPGNDQSWQGISPPLNVGQSFAPPDPVVPRVSITELFPTPNLNSPLPLGQFLFNLLGRRSPYIQQWTLSLQRTLPGQVFVEVAYVGSKGAKLSKRYDRNVIPALLQPGDTRTVQQRRPYPNLGFILSDEGAGLSKYHGLQSSLRKSYSSGLSFLVSHSWGRSMDTDSYDGKATRFYKPGDNDYGRSIFDVRQRLVASVNYALPFGQSLKGPARWIAHGWELNGIVALQSGLPFHVGATDRSNTGVSFGGRPNRTCNGNLPAGQRTIAKWFDTACFSEPALNTYGNGGVHYLDTDGSKTTDIGIFKTFAFSDARRLQFRYESFNLLNNSNLNRPANNASVPAVIGRVTGAQPARVMQFGLKFYW